MQLGIEMVKPAILNYLLVLVNAPKVVEGTSGTYFLTYMNAITMGTTFPAAQ